MNTTLSPVTVQRYLALQGELIGLVEQDYTGLTPNPPNLRNHDFRFDGRVKMMPVTI